MNNDKIDIIERVLQEDIDRKNEEELRRQKINDKLQIKINSKLDKSILIIAGIGLFLITLGFCLIFIFKYLD